MAMHLPPDLEDSIRERIASGRFDDESDVIREALVALDEREQERLMGLRAKIRVGFEQPGGYELTEALMDELERESEERFLHGEEPGTCPLSGVSPSFLASCCTPTYPAGHPFS